MQFIKLNSLFLALIFSSGIMLAQQSRNPESQESPSAIRFYNELNWNMVVAKAKAEKKLIFLDLYTSWCGPCRQMRQEIFSQKSVGDFMNNKFVCLSIQMDRTKNDDDLTKNWYDFADSLNKADNIQAYPGFHIYDSEGKIFTYWFGGSPLASDFIKKVAAYYDTTKSVSNILSNWVSNKGDAVYMLKAANAAKWFDKSTKKELVEAYLNTQKDLFKLSNVQWMLDAGLLDTSSSKWFQLLIKNLPNIKQKKNDQTDIDRLIGNVIYKEEIAPEMKYPRKASLNYQDEKNKIIAKYPNANSPEIARFWEIGVLDELTTDLLEKIQYNMVNFSVPGTDIKVKEDLDKRHIGFHNCIVIGNTKVLLDVQNQSWEKFGKDVTDHYDCAGNLLGLDWFKMYGIFAFYKCRDKQILLKCADWFDGIKNQEKPSSSMINLYANLLYKAGKMDDAIKWQIKAIELLKNEPITQLAFDGSPAAEKYKDDLDKMKKGERTWMNANYDPIN